MRHLPNLPHAGYSSKRQKETSDAIMFWLRGVERNRLLLLELVLDGRDKWRHVAGRVWKGLLVDNALLDSVYGYMALLALAADKRLSYTDPEKLIYVLGTKGLTPRLYRVLEQQRATLRKMAEQTAIDKVWDFRTKGQAAH